MNIKAVIFDLDGTLLDTIPDLVDNLNYTFKHLNLSGDFTFAEMETFIGSGKKQQIIRALSSRNYDLSHYSAVNDKLSEVYAGNISSKTKPFEGVEKLLIALKDKGIKIICLTNKPHDVALEVIDHYFPNTFDFVLGDRGNGIVKPDKRLLDSVLTTFNLTNNQALYVGDSDVDMETANNSNVTSVFVTYGYTRLSKVEIHNPKIVVNNAFDILKYVN